MAAIDKLTRLSSVAPGDLVPLFSSSLGNDAAVTISALTDYMAEALTGSNAIGSGVLITANTAITTANADTYSGKTLEFAGAYTVTLSASLPAGFGFVGIPPASGNASIASDGVVTLQPGTGSAATTTVTRAAASNALFEVCQRVSNTNAYIVTGA